MPLIEVDESDLKVARGAQSILDRLSKNPKTRAHLLSLVKADNPELAIPEIDVPVAIGTHVEEKLKATNERVEKLVSSLEEKEATRQVEETVSKARRRLRKAGHSDESIEAIEKLMVDRGIADYDAAEALWERSQPAPEQAEPAGGYNGREWGFARVDNDDADHTLLLKNPQAFSDKMVRQFLADRKSGRAA